MVITEKTLFDYIFFPCTLVSEIREEINSNPLYIKKLEFFKKLKLELDDTVNLATKRKLSQKIQLYKGPEEIILELIPDFNSENGEELEEEIKLFGNESEGIFIILSKREKFDYLFLFSLLDYKMEEVFVNLRPSGHRLKAGNKKISIPKGLFNITTKIIIKFPG